MFSSGNIDNQFIPSSSSFSSSSSPIPSHSTSTSSSNSIKSFIFATRGFKKRPPSQSIKSILSRSPSNSSMHSQRSQHINSYEEGLINPLNIPKHNSHPHYYTTTGDYDGTIINNNNNNNNMNMNNHHHHHNQNTSRQPSLSASTDNGLSHSSSQRSHHLLSPSMYDVRNSYDEPTSLAMYESNFTSHSNNTNTTNGSDYASSVATTTNNVYPPSIDMQRKAQYEYQQNENTFKVIYAGIISFKTVTALIPVVKKNYFVLTNHHLLQYKSEQKARSEINLFDHQSSSNDYHQQQQKKMPKIDPSKIVLQLHDVFAVHTLISPANTFRIEYLQPSTKHPQALVFTANNEKECKQWVDGLRRAIKVHHVAMMSEGTITSTERFAAVERLSKQRDMVDKRRHPLMIHKAIYKEKRIKITDGKRNTKEVFQVVTLAIGKFSLYLLPPTGVMDNEYLKSVERDRYGLLAIHSIQYSGEDDTFKLLFGQVGQPTRQLVLVSTYCEYIIQHLRQAIHAVSILPLPLSLSTTSSPSSSKALTYSIQLPSFMERTYINPLQTLIEDEEVNNDRDTDSIKSDPLQSNNNNNDLMINQHQHDILQFEIVLYAYCAAFNLNKARFNYEIYGPTDSRCFILSHPHEVNETSATYTKYELLAILRTIHTVNVFSEIILKQQSLKELEDWIIDKDDTWTTPTWKNINVNNVLSNEIHGILSSSNTLQRLDLTQCQIGSNMNESSSALTVIGLAMRNGMCGIRSLFIGKNNIKPTDLHSILTGIRSSRKTLLELDVHECQLNQEQIELLLTTILSERPEKIRLLDISLSPKDPHPHPHHSHYRHQKQPQPTTHMDQDTSIDSFEKKQQKKMLSLETIKSLLYQCKRLSILRIRGHHISLQHGLFDITQLKELDLGYNQLSTNDVTMLCKWMQHPSFNTLEALHVNGCGLNGHHFRELLIAITKSGNRRVHLNVGGNPVWREVMFIPKLCNALMQGEGPSSLSLAKTDWEDGTLREFLDCLRDNHTITHLDLSDIRVTGSETLSEDTIRVMATMFERNTALVELKLNDHMTRGKDGCAEIASGIVAALDALKVNRTLERLQMIGLGIGDVGAITLAKVLSSNPVLKSLHLDENKITIDGYRALASAFESQGCSIVDFPKPRKDIRYQLTTLKETIAELTQVENETKWFIMHSTGKDVKQAKTQLLLQVQARQTAELNYRQILEVVDAMLKAVTKNEQRYKLTHERTEELQLQAQSAAQEMAIAQLRLQSRITSANLSAVGAPRLRTREDSVSSYSSGSDRTGLTSTINSPVHQYHHQQHNNYQAYHMPRSHTWDSVSTRMGTSPTPNYTYESNGNHHSHHHQRNGTSMSDYPTTLSPSALYSHYEDLPNQPLPPTPQLLGDGLVSIRGDASVSGYSNHSSSGGSNASLSRRNTATTASTNFVTTPRTPYGTPSHYNQPSPSTSMSYHQQQRMRIMSSPDHHQHQEIDHPGFIDDFGAGYSSSSSMKPLQQQSQHHHQQQQQQYNYQKSHQQHRQQQIYQSPDIPDIYSVDSLQNEDRICEQFQNRLYLPPDERN